ncbi:hypothetical protein NDI85_08925 [Halomicroarcula sp. S1AR25-4]|uniref:DUF7289 family protein n=1 Tax=Haloarcula sp. S1AR25-4 TaxID=2950538 RepID=UPI0028740123|nr:hypothetical protein [Halomicroarcula sp. S1AR25-4]MDS0277917.1 hypothetical protein [Halomicroarcula sp. S1AR25-4]
MRSPIDSEDGQRRQRAQSAPLGVALMLAVMIVATTTVVALSAGAITGTQSELGTERTQKAMTELDSRTALVALGQSGVQQVSLSERGSQQYRVEEGAGWMNLSYENTTTGTQTTIYNETMGAVVYESETDRTIAYQGGGVWQSGRGDRSVMISPPEFHYRNATLTLPLVTVQGESSLDGKAVVTHNNTTRYFPNKKLNTQFQNPLNNGRVTVTVRSRYYRAWGAFFETRTDGDVEYEHANNVVTAELVAPVDKQRLTSATSSLSASGGFTVNGGATHNDTCGAATDVYTDSYNSSGTTNDYCTQASNGNLGDDGDVVYGRNIDISGGAAGEDFNGDLVSGRSVVVGNGAGKPDVDGNISYTDNCSPSVSDCQSRIVDPDGGVKQISGVDQAAAINGIVRDRLETAASDNDNAGTPADGASIDYTSGTAELEDGTYYLTDLTVASGDTLTLDTTGGDIVLAVQENVELGDGATIEVEGPGTVSLYVGGTGGHTDHVFLDDDAAVTNLGDDAPQFRAYGRDNLTVTIGGGSSSHPAKYVGVIYAPPGVTGTGSVTIDGGLVYGGILTGQTTIENSGKGGIHYDEALRTQNILSRDDSVVKVTYIHASVNQVNVTST